MTFHVFFFVFCSIFRIFASRKRTKMDEKELYINFDEYIRQGEPTQREKAGYWQTAIGLQAVDGLKVSGYLQETARRHIEGNITIDEARNLVNLRSLSDRCCP